MANPQLENGYTSLANEIVEALAKQVLSPSEWQVLMVIFRKTYGWKKKEDWISLSQFALSIQIKKPNIIRAINKLVLRNMIIRIDNEKGKMYRFNKDFMSWKSLSKQIMLSKQITSVIQTDNASLSKQIPTKETNTKETITKERIINDSASERLQILDYLKTRQNLKTLDGSQKWNMIYAKHLLKRFNGNLEKIKKFIDFALLDPFHQKNASSIKYLYNNLNKIALQAKSGQERHISL